MMVAEALNRKGSLSVMEAEVTTMLEGVSFARDLGFPEVMVETDSLVVGKLKGNISTPSGVGHLIADILHLQTSFRYISFEHCPLICNGSAHRLAKHGLAFGLDRFWMEECPPFIYKGVTVDSSF